VASASDAISLELLALLRCPETMQTLSVASSSQLAQIEAARAANTLRDRSGTLLRDPITAGLVRADGLLLFPIREGIPVLLIEEAVPLGAV